MRNRKGTEYFSARKSTLPPFSGCEYLERKLVGPVGLSGEFAQENLARIPGIFYLHLLHLFHFIVECMVRMQRCSKAGNVMSDLVQKAVATPSPASENRRRSGKGRQPNRVEITVNGVRIAVSQELEDAVYRAHQGLLRPMPKEMTTTQAAEFLDVSRPFIIKLITRGELPCRMVGKHRRIPSEALLEYRQQMFHQARRAADEMSQLAQNAGSYEEEPPRKAQ